MNFQHASFIIFTCLGLGCRPPQPCSDGCDDVGDDVETTDGPSDLPPPHDLPCGGADLLTDDLNCGSCGHECYIEDNPNYGEEWRGSGSCQDGKCGPIWHSCFAQEEGTTCREFLEAEGRVCATGCKAKTPGTTVLYFDLSETLGGTCWLQGYPAEYQLGCDDPLPWQDLVPPNQGVACCTAQE